MQETRVIRAIGSGDTEKNLRKEAAFGHGERGGEMINREGTERTDLQHCTSTLHGNKSGTRNVRRHSWGEVREGKKGKKTTGGENRDSRGDGRGRIMPASKQVQDQTVGGKEKR